MVTGARPAGIIAFRFVNESPWRMDPVSRVVAFLARLDVRRMAAFLLGGVAVMGVVGTISQVLYKGIWWFGLDAEVYIGSPLTTSTIAFPALYSGLLLIGAGIAWRATRAV